MSNEVYVSYARRVEQAAYEQGGTPLLDRLLKVAENRSVTLFESDLNQGCFNKVVRIRYDERDLKYGASIEEFMREIATSKHLLLLLSDRYFRSEYCMYELLNAYLHIRNRYRPAMVFIREPSDDSAEGAPILSFNEHGMPKFDTQAFKAYWKAKLKDSAADGGENNPAFAWYRKYRLAADELAAWVTGRPWGQSEQDTFLRIYDPSKGAEDDQIEDYLNQAMAPAENRYSWPCMVEVVDSCVARVGEQLRKSPSLKTALGVNEKTLRELLYENPTGFLNSRLTAALDSIPLQEMKHADAIFSLLVKLGVDIQTVHYRLQEMNASSEDLPHAVERETTLPETTTAFLSGREARFRKEENGDEHYYWGQREFVITDRNRLEVEELGTDAQEERSAGAKLAIWKLFRTQYHPDGRFKSVRGSDVSSETRESGIKNDLSNDKEDTFIITIRGLTEQEANEMTRKLKRFPLLKKVRIFAVSDSDKNIIKHSLGWYDAICAYLEAREQLTQ